MRVGVRLPQYGASWPEVRAAAARAERLGFDGLWLNDHLQSPGRVKAEPAFDAYTTLAALAPLTTTARLGIGVTSASYRPPALAGKMATVLDVISGGRLTLGLGTGSDRPEHRAYGIPFGTPRERTAGVVHALEVLRAMFDHPEGATVEGALDAAPNQPPPAQPGGPPIWLAAHGPRLLKLAGQRADGVFAAFLSPAELARRRELAEAAREAAGRPEMAYAVYTYAFAAPSEDEAAAWLAPEAEFLGTRPGKLLRWLRTTGIVGTLDEVRAGLDEFAEAGATDAILVLPNRVPPDAMEALAEAVLPAATATPARMAPRASGSPEDNLVTTLVERHREDGRGGDPAVVDDDEAWTYDDLGNAAARTAGALAELGVRRGERVALLLRDGRGWLKGFLGAARMGAVPVPLDPGMAAEKLADVLEDCAPACVVAEPDVEMGDWPFVPPERLLEGSPAPVAAVHPADLGYLIYSSGSTGRPKAAMHAHKDLITGIEGYARQVLGMGPGDRCHSVARFYTSLGFGNGFFRVLGTGATCVVSGVTPTVRTATRAVERHGVTVLTAVPTFWAQLARFLERHPDAADLSSLRLAVSSGDSLPRAVADRIREVAGIDLVEGLGCSECSNIVISTRPGDPRPGTLGQVVPGVEIRLADEDGRPVPSGTPGRLWIRSPANTSGYWRRVEETREVVHGPWIRMGDTLVEEDGVYRHMGRSDDLFKVDARWVSPSEVEGVLHEHGSVAQAAVVARPDQQGLLRPVAYVVLEGDPPDDDGLEADLRRHVARRLEPYKAPAEVVVLDELPRLASGKLDRRSLRDRPPEAAPQGAV